MVSFMSSDTAFNGKMHLANMDPIKPCITVLCAGAGWTFNTIFAELVKATPPDGRLMIDATHLKAHRTAASLLKKGLFPAASDAQKADWIQNSMLFAMARAKPVIIKVERSC